MKANKEFKDNIVICKNCGKEFHPRYSSMGIYCSLHCLHDYLSKLKYLEYLSNLDNYYGRSTMKWIKKHILAELNNKCAICNCNNYWNNKPLVFILDHIDGHANNNCRDNLRLICPNCDSLLDTFKSKNKHSDRIYRYNNIAA